MYYVYVLKCSDKTFYTGYTENIKKRIQSHKSGDVVSTSCRLPIKVKWIGIFNTKDKAIKFEKYLKSGSGNAFFKKRLI